MGPDDAANTKIMGESKVQHETDYKRMPFFEPVLAPILKSTDKKSISVYLQKRFAYELRIQEHNHQGDEVTQASITSTIDRRLLQSLCKYEQIKNDKDQPIQETEQVTDDMILSYLYSKREQQVTMEAPNLKRLLRINLKEKYIKEEEKILELFTECDELLENHGLEKISQIKQNAKKICQHIIDVLKPQHLQAMVIRHSKNVDPGILQNRSTLFKAITKYLSVSNIYDAINPEHAIESAKQTKTREKTNARNEEAKHETQY